MCLSQRSRIYAAAERYFKFLGGCQVTVAWSNGKVFFLSHLFFISPGEKDTKLFCSAESYVPGMC